MSIQIIFKINKYLELRLEEAETSIYINNKKFRQCKLVVLDLSINQGIEDFESIDDLLSKKFRIQDSKGISSEDEFWVHCSNLQAWSDNFYNSSLLDSYLAFPLLRKLVDFGDHVAQRVFKEEISRRLKSAVPQVIRFLINEGYTSFLDQSELFDITLNPKESLALAEISNYLKRSYSLIFEFDDLRDKFLNLYRNVDEIYNSDYYFSSLEGSIREIEILIDKDRFSIPKIVENLKHLERVYLYINNTFHKLSKFNFQLKPVLALRIFCYGSVRIPNLFKTFPNLKFLSISGDISGLTQLEITDSDQERLNRIETKLKNVILVKQVPQ